MTHIILIAIFLFIVDVILIAGVVIAMQNEKQYKNWKRKFFYTTKK